MGKYEKMALNKEKAINEGTFKGKEMSDERFNEILAELDIIKKIITDPELYESEREKYFKEKNE
jgi:hypothetical protein